MDLQQHRRSVWVGVAAILLLGTFPPWRYVVTESGRTATVSGGYSSLFDPPAPITRLRDFPTVLETLLARKAVETNPLIAAALQQHYSAQIDYPRLLLEWALIALALGAWILVGPVKGFAPTTWPIPRVRKVWRTPAKITGAAVIAVVVGAFVWLRVSYNVPVPGFAVGIGLIALWRWFERRSNRSE